LVVQPMTGLEILGVMAALLGVGIAGVALWLWFN
jgi:hypothetical protein